VEQKFVGPDVQGKVVSAPQGRARFKFLREFLLGGEIWRVRMVNLAVLACFLRDDD